MPLAELARTLTTRRGVLIGAGVLGASAAVARLRKTRPRPSASRSMGAHVVIVGAGLGGLRAAQCLASAPVHVTIMDQENYQTFQPLLHHVATFIVAAEDIAENVRGMLRERHNVRFRLARATGVDWEKKRVLVDTGEPIGFDYLILATGVSSMFHEVPGAAEHALPLKTLRDAVHIREHILQRFEAADAEPSLVDQGALNVVVVGGGTSGVETMGSLVEVFPFTLQRDYPDLDVRRARIVLVEKLDHLLDGFHPSLRRYALEFLRRKGVEVRLGQAITRVGPTSVTLATGEEIPCHTVLWTAGVGATPFATTLGLPQLPDGRILVGPDLRPEGRPEVFVIGDMAASRFPTGRYSPQLAQFALQGGRHAARQITRLLTGEPVEEFHYWDKGIMAEIGRNAGVVQMGDHIRLKGWLAWQAWADLHLFFSAGVRHRLSLVVNWLWSYATHDYGVRTIQTASGCIPTAREAASTQLRGER